VAHRSLVTTLVLSSLAFSGVAFGQFAEPPGQPLVAQDPPGDGPREYVADGAFDDFHHPKSTIRMHVGPGLRVSEHSPQGGLFAAVDIGERAAGARFSGAWVKVGGENGLQQYGGELWLDFGEGKRLHPILGAGAAVARLERRDPEDGTLNDDTLGVGILRGTLEYLLPVPHTDARAGIDVIGSIPAIRASNAAPSSPWLLVVATVGVGF
jgi:hypothetical protein